MNIGIDARVLEKGITGIGRYLEDILCGLPSIDKVNRYYLFSYKNLDINPDYYANISTCKPFLNDKIFSPFWLNFVLPKYIKKFQIDLIFTPNHLLPLRNIKAKSIITIHDVANKKNSSFHSLLYRLYINLLIPVTLKRCNRIITISKSAKNDIVTTYKINPEKIKVIYEHANKKFVKINVSNEDRNYLFNKYNFSNKSILYVGVIENRKNILGILNTADIINQKIKDISFVLIGRKGYGSTEIVTEINKRKGYVNYLGVINDSDLIKIYNLVLAFFFPSYYEGFGLPPLEAMQIGLPVLVSNSSSLPEIVGNGGIIKDADDAKGFADEILRLYGDSEYYETWKLKALKQASKFNYMDSINDLVNTFNEFESKLR